MDFSTTLVSALIQADRDTNTEVDPYLALPQDVYLVDTHTGAYLPQTYTLALKFLDLFRKFCYL